MLHSENPASTQSQERSRDRRRDASIQALCRVRPFGPTPTASEALVSPVALTKLVNLNPGGQNKGA
jgi:hypothetical protein